MVYGGKWLGRAVPSFCSSVFLKENWGIVSLATLWYEAFQRVVQWSTIAPEFLQQIVDVNTKKVLRKEPCFINIKNLKRKCWRQQISAKFERFEEKCHIHIFYFYLLICKFSVRPHTHLDPFWGIQATNFSISGQSRYPHHMSGKKWAVRSWDRLVP